MSLHALYAKFEALIDIQTFDVVRGELPRTAMALVSRVGSTASRRADAGLGVMQTESNAKKNSTVGLVEEYSSGAPWRVTSVDAIPEEYRLRVKFSDGTAGIVDMARLVRSPEAGVFAALLDPAVFGQVGIEYGAITWPGELDLAPDAMYDAIREHGVWLI